MLEDPEATFGIIIPSLLWTCPPLRELYLGPQMELKHVLGCVVHPRNPVHTPGALSVADARGNIPSPWHMATRAAPSDPDTVGEWAELGDAAQAGRSQGARDDPLGKTVKENA